MNLFGKPNIRKMSEKKDIKGLIKALKWNDGYIRGEAARALGKLRAETAISSLYDIFLTDISNQRTAAISLLTIGSERALNLITKEAENSNKNNFSELAKEAIAECKIKETIPSLKRMLLGENTDIQIWAAKVLTEMDWQPENDIEKAKFLVAKGDFSEYMELGGSSVKTLAEELKKRDSEAQLQIIKCLKEIGGPEATEVLETNKQVFRDIAKKLRNYPAETKLRVMGILNEIGGSETEAIIGTQKRYAKADMKECLSTIPISTYRPLWERLCKLTAIANFPIEPDEIIQYIKENISAKCKSCGTEIPHAALSALVTLPDFSDTLIFASGSGGYLSTGTCHCGGKFMTLSLRNKQEREEKD